MNRSININDFLTGTFGTSVIAFPLYDYTRASKVKWGTDENGVNDDQITYGIHCGKSGLVVVDVDVDGDSHDTDGLTTFQNILHDNGFDKTISAKGFDAINTFTVQTPSGGYHLYFKVATDADKDIRKSVGIVGEGIDIQAQVAMSMAPHSIVKKNGKERVYTVINDAVVMDMPQWLRETIIKKQTKVDPNPEPYVWIDSPIPVDAEGFTPYARTTLTNACERLSRVATGRNNALNAEAFSAAKAGAPVQEVIDRLSEVARSIGLPDSEIKATVEQSARKGADNYDPHVISQSSYDYMNKLKEFRTPTVVKLERPIAEGSETTEEVEVVFNDRFFSDAGQRDRLTKFLKSKNAVYVPEWKNWSAYNKKTGVWVPVDKGIIRNLTRTFLDKTYSFIEENGDDKDARRARFLLDEPLVERLTNAAGDNLQVSSSTFDQNPDHVVVANGIVDLRTLELSDFDPKHYSTKRIAINFNPDVDNTLWELFLEAFNKDVLPWFQVYCGQALTGHQPDDPSICFLHGEGENGKSVWNKTAKRVYGDYYGVPERSLLLGDGSAARDAMTIYKGLRVAVVEELPNEKVLNMVAIKALSGTEDATAAEKYQAKETFEIIATSFVNTNHLPKVYSTDHGTWRRLKVVAMPYRFRKEGLKLEKPNDRRAAKELRGAQHNPVFLEAALLWTLIGAKKWYANGQTELLPSASMNASIRDWRGDNDKILSFFEDALQPAENYFITNDDLYRAYSDFVKDSGQVPEGKISFLRDFETHQEVNAHSITRVKKQPHSDLRQAFFVPKKVRFGENDEIEKAPVRANYFRGVAFASTTIISDDKSEEMNTDAIDERTEGGYEDVLDNILGTDLDEDFEFTLDDIGNL